MIVEWFARILTDLVVDGLDGVQVPEVPGWFDAGVSGIGSVIADASQLGNWIPVPMFASVLLAVIGCLVAGVALQLTRIVLSFFTAGGGGT